MLFFSVLISHGQEKIKLQGLVKDSVTQEIITYATVSLFKKEDPKSVVINTFSDSKGQFVLNSDTGNYVLAIDVMGYNRLTRNIKAYMGMLAELGAFLLKPSANQLQQVTITGQKPLIEQDRDKLIYNVEQDPAAKGESLTEVFRKIPMLSVDGEGNVRLNGQGNFKVLLNGRETAMFAQSVKDALNGFPGAVVSKIEVITSPSAKYDAEGIGGLINIITKKAIFGYNGYLGLHYSSINYSANTNLSFRKGKFAVTATYFLSGNHNNKAQVTSETLPLQAAAYKRRFLEGERITNRFSNSGIFEMSYNIDTLQTIVLYANVDGGNNKNRFTQNITTSFVDKLEQVDFFTQNVRNNFPSYGLGSDFIRKFKGNPDTELSFRFNGQFNRNDGLNTSKLDMASADLFRQNDSYSKNREYTLQTDFIQPFTKALKLETGAKFIFRDADADYLSLSRTDESLPFEPDYSNSDSFAYKQQVYSGYSSLSFALHKVNFRTGLRLEYTTVECDFFSSKTTVKKDYTILIPDFSMNTKISKNYTIIFGYNKRLQRPYINALNPFINNNDPLNISFGNPDLDAQTIHNLSFQNRLASGNNFIALALNASYSGNMIVQYTTFNENNGVSTTQYGNTGRNRELSAMFTSAISLKKLNCGVYTTVRYNKIENTVILTQHEEGFSGQVGGFFFYKPVKSFSLSGSGGISRLPPSLINTLKANPYYQVNVGYKFFNDKLSTTVNFNNFFSKSLTNRSYTEDVNFTTNSTTTIPFRVVFVGATYNFGKLKENLSKKKGVNNDDLINN
ncbi:outer membrane beta-barrel protein [Pedobacter soli]|uniref:Outer membrane receptor proteins, mostly Fe transport n=1 Tax=Pedobacter soli TaxID=390242 RepID=A0A1G6TJL8_9SPHI|nr:outer membrane beta-barrel protein [Pedobacter soli]SDD29219.1 Outer membrane receptor proteins, mostly Fe transport [Pedobacter soli]